MNSGVTGGALNPKNAPYLVLGVHSRANSNEVLSAFALSSRRIKNNSSSPFTIHELTEALDIVQNKSSENSNPLQYSIPANPRVHNQSASFESLGKRYTPTSDFSDLDISSIQGEQRAQAAQTFLSASLHELFVWNFEKSMELAKTCLRLSVDEDERDEALNVLAANLAFSGELSRSLDALKKAVEGRWNLALQTNLALLAIEEDPGLAVTQMSFLIDGAQTISEKLAATRTAIALWTKTQSDETGSDDEDDFAPLPDRLLRSMHSLIGHPSMTEEEFFDIGMFLARVEGEKFVTSNEFRMAVHNNTLSSELVRLRAKGIFEFVNEVVRISRRDTQGEKPWIQSQVDEFVEMIVSRLTSDDDENGSGASLAFSFLDQGLDCSTFSRTALRPLLIQEIAQSFDPTHQPNEKFIQWYKEASVAISSNRFNAPEERLEILRPIHSHAGNILGALYHSGIISFAQQLESGANSVRNRMSGIMNRFTANKTAIRSISLEIIQGCDECITTYNKVIPFVSDHDLRNNMNNILRALNDMRTDLRRFI
jgi:hypothetical protein